MMEQAVTAQSCFVCGVYDETLRPLYAERSPEARPVAWIHKACLAGGDTEEEGDMQRRSRPRPQPKLLRK
jgi:hypothetical protein